MKSKFLLILAVVLTFMVITPRANAQQDKKFVVGILNPGITYQGLVDSFEAKMATLGYVDGTNITYLYDGATAASKLDAEAKKLVDAKVDVIVSMSTTATTAAFNATKTIPVIFGAVVDPVGAGFVKSLAAPGGNVTGVTNGGANIPRLNYFLMLVPKAKKMLIVVNPNDVASKSNLAEIMPILAKQNINLVEQDITDAKTSAAALEALPPGIDSIFLTSSSLIVNESSLWGDTALKLGIPLSAPRMTGTSILLAYNDDLSVTGQQVADLVNKILTGSTPDKLPVATSKFILSLNMDAAQALKLNVILATQ